MSQLPEDRSPTDPADQPPAVHATDHNELARGHNIFDGTTPATFALAAHNQSATTITSGTMATARLGSGTANTSTFLRGDSTWQTVVTSSPAPAVDTVYFSVPGNLVSGSVGTARAPVPGGNRTITRVTVTFPLASGPSGQSAIFDVNLWASPYTSGSTVWSTTSNRVTVASGQTRGVQTAFNTTAFPDGSLVSVDVDQAGSSGTTGHDAVIAIDFQAA